MMHAYRDRSYILDWDLDRFEIHLELYWVKCGLSFSPILITVILCGIIEEKVYWISYTKIAKSSSSNNY